MVGDRLKVAKNLILASTLVSQSEVPLDQLVSTLVAAPITVAVPDRMYQANTTAQNLKDLLTKMPVMVLTLGLIVTEFHHCTALNHLMPQIMSLLISHPHRTKDPLIIRRTKDLPMTPTKDLPQACPKLAQPKLLPAIPTTPTETTAGIDQATLITYPRGPATRNTTVTFTMVTTVAIMVEAIAIMVVATAIMVVAIAIMVVATAIMVEAIAVMAAMAIRDDMKENLKRMESEFLQIWQLSIKMTLVLKLSQVRCTTNRKNKALLEMKT